MTSPPIQSQITSGFDRDADRHAPFRRVRYERQVDIAHECPCATDGVPIAAVDRSGYEEIRGAGTTPEAVGRRRRAATPAPRTGPSFCSVALVLEPRVAKRG